ncbi:MAG: DUF4124 domain-containing protein [Geobacteraceae bacterium]|nr:DUF4124 domain-containing protein [Geobacteraceae bacterium]
MRNLILIILLLALPTLCAAEIYKWVDDKGQVGFADDLGKVPQKYRDRAFTTEKQEQAVEIIEKVEPEKGAKKGVEGKGDSSAKDDKVKDKPSYEGKTVEAWKQDLARQKHETQSLEEQLTGIKERLADSTKKSRGEVLTLQNTQRDLEVRLEKARKKLDALNAAADRAGVPGEIR